MQRLEVNLELLVSEYNAANSTIQKDSRITPFCLFQIRKFNSEIIFSISLYKIFFFIYLLFFILYTYIIIFSISLYWLESLCLSPYYFYYNY